MTPNTSITPQSLLQDRATDVWVVNETHNLGLPNTTERRDLVFVVSLGDNQRQTVSVHASWLPVNLADFAPARDIAKSPHFLKAVTEGALVLLAPEDAVRILAEPRAQAERARLRQAKDALTEANRRTWNEATTVQGNDETATGASLNTMQVVHRGERRTKGGDIDLSALDTSTPTVGDDFVAFANNLLNGSEADAAAKLKQRGRLTRLQAEHLRSVLQSAPRTFPGILKFLNSQLA